MFASVARSDVGDDSGIDRTVVAWSCAYRSASAASWLDYLALACVLPVPATWRTGRWRARARALCAGRAAATWEKGWGQMFSKALPELHTLRCTQPSAARQRS